MVLTLAHVFDRSAGWEQRVATSQLLDRLPRDRFRQQAAAIDRVDCLARALPTGVVPCPARLGLAVAAAPALRRFFESHSVRVANAWGIRAAVAARAAGASVLAVELFDPVEAALGVKVIRSLATRRGFAVVCSCEIVRRRLIEGGLAPDATVVIRPGVDFGRINAIRRAGLRASLGLEPDVQAVLVSSPVRRDGGQLDTAAALGLLAHRQPNLALILPWGTSEADRIRRLIASLPKQPLVISPPSAVPYEELIVAANGLAITPRGDASTTAIAWAMGAKTAVVGSAVHCVAELIAHRVNGRLFKPTRGRPMALAIARTLRDRASLESLAEAAHGQAYQVFGVRRYVDQHVRLYENLLDGRLPADGVVDSSRTA